ncbi:MAG: histidinol-phosphatase [Alphaproteobacteria bacterium]|nr:histidinol-phosphatase [Alphaproteobacteria bacterium]
MQEFSPFANKLADEAGVIARKYFRQPFEVISKADESPVTVADREIEKRLREIIESARPEDGIFGEEFGVKESRNGLTWVLDPIDGTKSFVIGRPTFGTLIALCEDEIPVLGVIDQPISQERWIGVKGQQTLFNGAPLKTRPCKNLKEACAGSTTPAMFSKTGRVYERIEPAVKMLAWGGDCYMYGLLASGFMDVCFEASLSPYDFCALVPVVEGAGGVMCDWSGQPLTMKSDGQVVAVGDAALKESILKLLT